MDKNSLRVMLIQIRNETGWTQKHFAEFFYIPRRTLQEWEYGKRGMAEYLLRLMVYKLEHEDIIHNFSERFDE